MGLEDITLSEFKECLKGNYSMTKDEWLGIYDEYNQALNTKGNDVAFEIKKQTYILNNEKAIISTCLFVIAKLIEANIVCFDDVHEFDGFIKVIAQYGFVFDKKKPAESLNKIHSQLRNYDTRINSELKKLEKIENDSGAWSFDDTIGSVEKYMGFQIDEDKTNMKKFVSYINQMLRQNK